ncbi:unnamed protein product [Arctia plantaginis]|uniref:Peptidoglycan-recognition protein n=1 Tax=Arctia plantaginis TaxID=874455 RepID=A0A8S1ABP2_ARCPL|nr:unnamed protein product [Arctia plantaginis]
MASSRVSCVYVIVLLLNFSVSVFPGVVKEVATSDLNDFPLISRDGWHAEPSANQKLLKLPTPYVVIHHTYIPKACYSFEECANAMRSMQRYHKSSLKWGDIGYNFCIGAEGTAFEGRGWDYKGIHAGRANNHSIGICMIGDWREKLPPKKSMDTLKALIKIGVQMGKIREDYKLIGHMQAMSTECPGTALMAEISTWKNFAQGKPDFAQISSISN